MWLNQAFHPASAFVPVDRNEARNPQRFHTASRYNKAIKPDLTTGFYCFQEHSFYFSIFQTSLPASRKQPRP
jgi:hypothetical protein